MYHQQSRSPHPFSWVVSVFPALCSAPLPPTRWTSTSVDSEAPTTLSGSPNATWVRDSRAPQAFVLVSIYPATHFGVFPQFLTPPHPNCFFASQEMVRIKPRNLLKRPAAVRPKAPHRWTGASLDLCYEFLLCARRFVLPGAERNGSVSFFFQVCSGHLICFVLVVSTDIHPFAGWPILRRTSCSVFFGNR